MEEKLSTISPVVKIKSGLYSINEVKKLKEKREKEKNDYLEKNNENINIIKDLTEEQKELLEKIPSDKICKSSNKDISYNEFLKLNHQIQT